MRWCETPLAPSCSVLDGDTIEVLHNTHAERVRLNGIDCPEKGQAYGDRAKQAASALVFGRDVILQTHGQDKYKRTLADVSCSMGPTSTTHWSKTAGAGGIGNTRQEIRNWNGWNGRHETRGKACGLIRHLSHRGSIGRQAREGVLSASEVLLTLSPTYRTISPSLCHLSICTIRESVSFENTVY